jgi:DNA-binding MurR/RpiR family transcriptional regulator
VTFNYDDQGKINLDIIANRRRWQLEQLEKNTEILAQFVREEHAKGVELTALSKRAGVSRPTIYRWIGEGSSDHPSAT